MELSRLTDNFLIKLRTENFFDTADYEELKSVLTDKVVEWKKAGSVPVRDVLDVVILIDQLAGGSRFFDEETTVRVEDACIEIENIIGNII